MTPLVSVIIPTYNQAPFLPEALNSVLKQSHTHLEILLVDDGSTDDTPAICQTFAAQDRRIQIFRQENRGPSAARNQGIMRAKGTYLCLLDSDDRMEEGKIEQQLALFSDFPEVDIVYTALYVMNEQGERIGEVRSQDLAPPDFLAQMFFRNVIPNPNTIMAQRECLAQHLYNEAFKHAEDYELMLRLAHLYRFKYLDQPLTSYRRHPFNLSNDLQAHRQAELKVLHRYGTDHIATIVDRSSLDPQDKCLMKGKIFFNMELFHEALAFLKQVSSPSALFYQGNCYFKLQDLQHAMPCYQQALAADDQNAACYNNLGAVYVLLNQPILARDCFEKALKLQANYMDAAYNVSQADHPFTPRLTLRELRKQLLTYYKM